MDILSMLLIVGLAWFIATLAAVVRICIALFSERVRNQIFAHPIIHVIWFGMVILGIAMGMRTDIWITRTMN